MFVLVWLGLWIIWGLTNLKRKLWLIGGVALVFLLVLLTQYQYVGNRFNFEHKLEKISIEERTEGINLWQNVFGQYAARGSGAGNYAFVLQKVDSSQPSWWYQPVHNLYLLVAGELGVIGVAIWLWLMAAVLTVVYWIWRRRKELVTLGIPIVAIFLLGLVDHWLISLQQGRLLIFVALALTILGYRLSLKELET